MKTKTRRRRSTKGRAARVRQEENIFNPFAPMITAMKRWSRRQQIEPAGSFRNAFIMVLLVHIAAGLVVTGYSAIGKSAKSSMSRADSQSGKSTLARRLDELNAKMVPSGHAKVGDRLEPVRENDPLLAQSSRNIENGTSQPRAKRKETKMEEDSLPLVKTPASTQIERTGHKPDAAAEEAAKRTFLEATGRLERGTPSSSAGAPVPRAEPVAEATEAARSSQEAQLSSYVVQPGDNIFIISRRMNASFAELAKANNLSSPRDLRVGQTLVIPGQERL